MQRREEAKSRQLQETKNKVIEMKKQRVQMIKKMKDDAKAFKEKDLQVLFNIFTLDDIILKSFLRAFYFQILILIFEFRVEKK